MTEQRKLIAYVVEDHPKFGPKFRDDLQEYGVEAILFTNRQAAVEALAKRCPDILLLDGSFPLSAESEKVEGGAGLKLLKELLAGDLHTPEGQLPRLIAGVSGDNRTAENFITLGEKIGVGKESERHSEIVLVATEKGEYGFEILEKWLAGAFPEHFE